MTVYERNTDSLNKIFNSRKPIKSSQAKLHSDNMEDVRERLENTVTQSSVETLYDDDYCFITVTQKNYETGNESEWSFGVDFGTNKVQMLEPVEDEEGFTYDNEVYRIIKNFLNGGSSREKRMSRPDYDSREPIKVTGKGNKIGSSRKSIKSSKSVCIGFNNDTGALLWKRDDLYTLDNDWVKQTKRKDIADGWIKKYNLNTTDTRRLDRLTQEGPGSIPWGLPLVEDKDGRNYNAELASILPKHGLNDSKKSINNSYIPIKSMAAVSRGNRMDFNSLRNLAGMCLDREGIKFYETNNGLHVNQFGDIVINAEPAGKTNRSSGRYSIELKQNVKDDDTYSLFEAAEDDYYEGTDTEEFRDDVEDIIREIFEIGGDLVPDAAAEYEEEGEDLLADYPEFKVFM